MVVGFNHNVRYRGDLFHVQTEDSGIDNPSITTLLFRGGTIISSRKTSYADIIKIENLDRVVEELMKEQHKEMLRRLKNGEFDARAFPSLHSPPPAEPAVKPPPEVDPAPAPSPPVKTLPHQAVQPEQSLDEIILAYLASDRER